MKSGYSAVTHHVRCQGAHPQDVPARQCGREEAFALFLKRDFEVSLVTSNAFRRAFYFSRVVQAQFVLWCSVCEVSSK